MEASRQNSKGLPAIELLTIAALVGGVLLVVSEFLDLFHVVGVNGRTIDSASTGANHGHALLVIGVVAIASVFLARSTEQWLPAAGGAALGAIALVITLAGDLPDAVSSGLTRSHQIGNAHPSVGLWVELVGALMVAAACAGIARLLRNRDEDQRPRHQR